MTAKKTVPESAKPVTAAELLEGQKKPKAKKTVNPKGTFKIHEKPNTAPKAKKKPAAASKKNAMTVVKSNKGQKAKVLLEIKMPKPQDNSDG